MDFKIGRSEITAGTKHCGSSLFRNSVDHQIAEIQLAPFAVTLAVFFASERSDVGVAFIERHKFDSPHDQGINQRLSGGQTCRSASRSNKPQLG